MNLQEEYPYFHPSGYIFVKVNIKDFKIQPAFTCSKLTIKTSERDVILVSLLLTLNRFHTLFVLVFPFLTWNK